MNACDTLTFGRVTVVNKKRLRAEVKLALDLNYYRCPAFNSQSTPLLTGQFSNIEHSATAIAIHSVLFKAPGAQFVTLAGSSQANILYEMHFSRCLSEGSKQPWLFLPLQILCSDSH